jgi:murein DD-endopeptidase MepM/ murein hydrolase activator NlpD
MTSGEALAIGVFVWLALRRSATLQLADGWVWPVPKAAAFPPQISQEFKAGHVGVDVLYRIAGRWTAPDNTPIIAANAGTVTVATRSPRGFSVVVDHGRGLQTFYQHMSELAVKRGQRVAAGARLGTMGSDPLDAQHVRHLHFELWHDGVQVDPEPLMATWKIDSWTP